MKASVRAATAIGVGYLLGRNRRFRTAALMAAATAAGGTGLGGPIVRRGIKMLGSAEVLGKVTPQLAGLADAVRGDLVTAGKAAATAAVSNRVDALTDSIHDRAERVRNPAATAAEGAEKATEAGQTAAKTPGRAASGAAKRAGSMADGADRRPTGRGKAEAEAEPNDYEPDDSNASDDGTRDDYEHDDEERDDYEDYVDEDEDYDDEDQDEDEDGYRAGPSDHDGPPVPGDQGEEVSRMLEANSNGPMDRLKAEAGGLVGALAERTMTSVRDKVEDTVGRLTDYVEGEGGPGLVAAATGAKGMAEGKSPARSALSAGWAGLKKNASGIFSGGKGKSGGQQKLKLTNIVESIEVGVPLRLAYNQWTTYRDFPTFTKKIENAQQNDDDNTKVNWKAQVFWSHREWEATITDQRPDERIIWRSKGQKGHVDGVVTFHELTPNLTKIVVVLEYHPQGCSSGQATSGGPRAGASGSSSSTSSGTSWPTRCSAPMTSRAGAA